MNNSCYVPGCKSGYSSCKEKVSLFGAPKDEHRRNKWNLVIPRLDKVISTKDVVCEKHFRSEDIIRIWKSGDIEIKLKKPKLISTAVPSIFPKNVNYKPRKRSKQLNNINKNIPKRNRVDQLFNLIWKKRHLIIMPSPEWGLHSLLNEDMKRIIIISECEISDSGVPHYRKQMHISEQLKLTFYVGDQHILKAYLAKMWQFVFEIKNRFALQKCLNSWHAVRVCDGGPTTNIYRPNYIATNIACPTPNGLWRHRHCTLLYYDQNQCCTQCYTLYDLFKQQFSIRVYSPIKREIHTD